MCICLLISVEKMSENDVPKLDDIISNELANFEVVVLKSVSGCLEVSKWLS